MSDVDVYLYFALPHHRNAALAERCHLRTRLLGKVIYQSHLPPALVTPLGALQLSLPLDLAHS
jgi:hypothetical protein